MKNIIDIYEGSLSSNKLDESSILADVEDTLARGEDDIMLAEIERKLQNDDIYYFHYSKFNQKPYTIKKVRGKWVVDALGDLTVYGVADNGCITDGTFSFGVINGNYIISMPESGGAKLKSLQYGPTEVRDDFDIYYGGDLKDLQYCPKTVHGWVNVSGTNITTLKYFPSFVGGNVSIRDNKELKNVKDLRKCRVNGYLIFKNNGISGPSVITNFANKWNILFSSANVIEGQEMTSEGSILGDIEDTLNDKTIFKKANDQIDWIYDMLNGWSTDNWETNDHLNSIDRSYATTKLGERSYAARKWKGLKELCQATTGKNYLWMDITIRRRRNKRTLNIEAYDIKISWYNDSRDEKRYISIMSIPESKFKSWDDLAQDYVVPIFKSIDSMIDHFEKYKPEIQEY